jgi:hypothetical protein
VGVRRERLSGWVRALAGLHEDGIVSDAEYEAKKAELLARW